MPRTYAETVAIFKEESFGPPGNCLRVSSSHFQVSRFHKKQWNDVSWIRSRMYVLSPYSPGELGILMWSISATTLSGGAGVS